VPTRSPPATPLLPGETVFDIAPEAKRVWRSGRAGRVLGLWIIAIMLGVFVLTGEPARLYSWFAGRGFSSGPAGLNIVGFCVPLGLTAYTAVLLYVERPGPEWLILDQSGLRLRYRRGSELSYRWDDPKFRLDLYDYQSIPDSQLSSGLRFVYCVRDRHDFFLSTLSAAAFGAILDTARIERLDVNQIKPPKHRAAGGLRGVRVLRISARARTNHFSLT
jgi:hypothetical protein